MDGFDWLKVLVEGVAFLANLITIVLGTIALYGLLMHGRVLKAYLALLAAVYLNERIKRIKETLGKLEALNYNDKEVREEILALLGQLSGQIKPLLLENPRLLSPYNEIMEVLNKGIRLSEPMKRRILYEVHGELDNQTIAASSIIAEESR